MAYPLVSKAGMVSDPVKKTAIKPKALVAGDTIGIIAPGTAVTDPDDLYRAEEALEYLSLKYQYGRSLRKGSGYKSRTVDERLDDLHSMTADDNIKGIFCIRGGYGSGQLLDRIDYKLLADNPKAFIGYSDITAMHLAINKHSGLVTFHGPVLLSSFSSYTLEYFKKAVFSQEPVGIIRNPVSGGQVRESFPVRTINPGIAKGTLTGGNLSLVCSLMGTPYEIETENKILFLEDVGEAPYRIDRMLTQLRLAGKLHKAAGIVFGLCNDCDTGSAGTWDFSLGEVLDNILGPLSIPVFYGLTIGHTYNQATIPYGLQAELNADKGILDILESGVI